jgi:cell division protein ZapE
MSLLKEYQQLIENKHFQHDKAQLLAISCLDTLTVALETPIKNNSGKGIYLWGKVGRGKTMMMDMFYQHLTLKNKQRIHFHHFIEAVHQRLNQLTGHDDPLEIIANEWAEKVKVLCFDEFFVSDIGDAMLLAGLFKALFAKQVILVATSNCQPEQLYRNGLQRQRFLPTIALLNQYCQVISVNGELDHRLSKLTDCPHYYFPASKHQHTMLARYQQFTSTAVNTGNIVINYRKIDYLAQCDDVIWFDFFALCSGPRSQRDYMVLAQQFSTVFISNVPQFSGELIPAVFSGIEDSYQRSGVLLADLRKLDDEARRFIALVDEFYDQKIKLIISSDVDIFKLYHGTQLAFEFARCESRLIEMQSAQYFDRAEIV